MSNTSRKRSMVARAQVNGGAGGDRLETRALGTKPAFDSGDDRLALLPPARGSRASGDSPDPHAHEKDDHAERRAGQEGEPPSELRIDQRRIEQRDRDQSAECRPDPETAVDHQIDMAAVARRDQLLDGRIDGGVFSADAASGEETKQEEGEAVP